MLSNSTKIVAQEIKLKKNFVTCYNSSNAFQSMECIHCHLSQAYILWCSRNETFVKLITSRDKISSLSSFIMISDCEFLSCWARVW